MTIEKMRKDFEAHYARDFSQARGYEVSAEEIASMRDGDWYGDRAYLNGYWKGWQASCAALMINLPKRHESDYGANTYQDDEGDLYFVDDVVSAIEAAGLKVKS